MRKSIKPESSKDELPVLVKNTVLPNYILGGVVDCGFAPASSASEAKMDKLIDELISKQTNDH